MNDQNPEPIPSPNPPAEPVPGTTPPTGTPDWHDQRRAERLARRDARWQRRTGRHTGWFAGVLLILLGLILLLQQMNIPILTNWWALFILIPSYWCYVAAWDAYQDAGRLTRRAATSLAAGLLLTLLTLIFLFNLNLISGFFWPVLLLLGGLVLLGTALLPE